MQQRSLDEQLLVMAAGARRCIPAGGIQQSVLRSVLISLAEWTREHEAERQRILSLLAE